MPPPSFTKGSGTLYFAVYTTNNGDWTVPQNDHRWQDLNKTLFDPCPSGWRVPLCGAGKRSPWSAFTVDNSIWNGESVNPLGGRTYDMTTVHGPTTAWYPASGFRETNSFISLSGTYTHNWPSTPGFQFHTTAIGVYPEYLYEGRSRAYSVRCIRE